MSLSFSSLCSNCLCRCQAVWVPDSMSAASAGSRVATAKKRPRATPATPAPQNTPPRGSASRVRSLGPTGPNGVERWKSTKSQRSFCVLWSQKEDPPVHNPKPYGWSNYIELVRPGVLPNSRCLSSSTGCSCKLYSEKSVGQKKPWNLLLFIHIQPSKHSVRTLGKLVGWGVTCAHKVWVTSTFLWFLATVTHTRCGSLVHTDLA